MLVYSLKRVQIKLSIRQLTSHSKGTGISQHSLDWSRFHLIGSIILRTVTQKWYHLSSRMATTFLAVSNFTAVVRESPEFLDTLLTITKITHVWYRNNEPRSLLLLVASITILCIPSTALLIRHVGSFFIAFPLALLTFSTALLGSISLYRLSPLHPLAKYPGPTRCKLTKIWMAWISFWGRPHIYYKTLHDKDGPIVRIGESLFDIFDFNWLYF